MGYLVLSGVDNNEPLDESEEDSSWLRLSHSEVAVLCVQCNGEARVRDKSAPVNTTVKFRTKCVICNDCLVLIVPVQDYSLKMTPPALLIPYRLPLATNTKQIKVSFCIIDIMLMAVVLIFLTITPVLVFVHSVEQSQSSCCLLPVVRV